MQFVRSFGLHQPEQTPCGQALSVSEAYALTTLADTSPLNQKDLSAQLSLEKSSVSRLVRKLEQRGWIERSHNQQDGRSKLLALSKAGRDVVNQLQQARSTKFDEIFARIPTSERQVVLSSLTTLIHACDQVAKESSR